MQPGARLAAVDGRPTAAALAAVPAWLTAASAERTRARLRAEAVLTGPPDAPVTVEFADGKRVTLAREPRRHDRLSSRFAAPGVLVVAVPGLYAPAEVTEFDAALAQPGVRALVLDLRDNGGGNSQFADEMVGRLVDKPTPYAHVCYPPLRPRTDAFIGCGTATVEPRAPRFAGKVAVLLDGGAVSSGEFMAASLCDTHVARCFGRTTAGGSGHPVAVAIPGGQVRFSTRSTYRLTGDDIERNGVPPDEVIAWHVDDLVAHRDPDLDAALRWIAAP